MHVDLLPDIIIKKMEGICWDWMVFGVAVGVD